MPANTLIGNSLHPHSVTSSPTAFVFGIGLSILFPFGTVIPTGTGIQKQAKNVAIAVLAVSGASSFSIPLRQSRRGRHELEGLRPAFGQTDDPVSYARGRLTLPFNAPSESSCIIAVRFGARDENKRRLLNLPLAPPRPTFRRRLFILINAAIHAFRAQSVKQRQDTIHMHRRVVTVANENLGHSFAPNLSILASGASFFRGL